MKTLEENLKDFRFKLPSEFFTQIEELQDNRKEIAIIESDFDRQEELLREQLNFASDLVSDIRDAIEYETNCKKLKKRIRLLIEDSMYEH